MPTAVGLTAAIILAVAGIGVVAVTLLAMLTIAVKPIARMDTMLPIVRIMMKPAVLLPRKKSWISVPLSARRLSKSVVQLAKRMRSDSKKS